MKQKHSFIIFQLIGIMCFLCACKTVTQPDHFPSCFIFGWDVYSLASEGKELEYDLRLVGNEYNKATELVEYLKALGISKKKYDLSNLSAAPDIKITLCKDKNTSEIINIYLWSNITIGINGLKTTYKVTKSEYKPIAKFLKKLHDKYGDEPNFDIEDETLHPNTVPAGCKGLGSLKSQTPKPNPQKQQLNKSGSGGHPFDKFRSGS